MQLLGNTITGGWSQTGNLATVGQGMESLGSTFFPAPQRLEVAHLPVESAGGTGQTFRLTDKENESMNDTFSYFMNDWKNTPYEQQYAVGPKIAESKLLSDSVSRGGVDWLGQGLDWALGVTGRVKTIVESWDAGKKPIAVNTAGSSTGGAKPSAKTQTTEFGTFVKRGAEVLETFKSAAGNILGQAKGLFNLGFEGTGDKSPVFSIQHELDTGTKLAVGSTGIIILVLVAIFLLRGRK